MDYRISRHAEDELRIRNISRKVMEEILTSPQQTIDQESGMKVLQSRVVEHGTEFLVRVVVAFDTDPPTVVTLYKTTKIGRYWQT